MSSQAAKASRNRPYCVLEGYTRWDGNTNARYVTQRYSRNWQRTPLIVRVDSTNGMERTKPFMSSPRLNQILDTEKLSEHVKNGFVNIQTHRTLPLRIFNYSHLAQFEKSIWGDGTIDLCRGLIVDKDDVVVARPFRKFWNLGTAHAPESMEENLPKVAPTVLEKLDGSLGIYWEYEKHVGIATRGSFHSPQAEWANGWLYRQICSLKHGLTFPEDYTPLFEIIYPENRIVCTYDFEGLVLLGLVNKETGFETVHEHVEAIGKKNDLRVVYRHKKFLAEIVAENEVGREGYVLSYHSEELKPPVKVKVKFADYVRLHRVVTGMNPKSVWEILSSNGSLSSLFDGTPQHFQDWLSHWEAKLENEHLELVKAVNRVFAKRPFYPFYVDKSEKERRKACAEYFKAEAPHLTAPLFRMLDGDVNGAQMAVWKMIKPKCNEQDTFRKDGE